MDEKFDIQKYLTEGVEQVVKDALRATLMDPKESKFLAKFAIASKKASAKREAEEKAGLHVPSYLIASITSSCNLHCAGCYSRCNQATTDMAPVRQVTSEEWLKIFEEADDLGRLFDIDVINTDGSKLSRNTARRCLICDSTVQLCARNRTHTAKELYHRAIQIIRNALEHDKTARIAACAQQALMYEALVTPKPGLVDRSNSGSHTDMDVFTFAASASARACTSWYANTARSLLPQDA
jgi:hypothetical protein